MGRGDRAGCRSACRIRQGGITPRAQKWFCSSTEWPLHLAAPGDVVFASRSGETPIVGYRKMWLRIAKLGGLPANIRPHVMRHSFASLAADLSYSEPTIASLLGHKTHSITSRYMHSADAVANATMKLMASDQAQPQLRDQHRDGSVVRDGITYKEVFS
jgi:integrase